MNPKLKQLRERKIKERSIRPKHSFAGRVTRWVMATVLLTMTLLMVFIYWISSTVIEIQSQQHFQSIMYSTTKEVDMLFKGVEIAIDNTLPDVEDNLNDIEELHVIMRQFLRLNTTVKGVAIAFEPYYYPDKGRWYEPYLIRRSQPDDADSLVVECKQIGSSEHNYHTSPWYMRAVTTGESSWTDPYVDSFGGEGMLCSYVQPVHDSKGKIVAVFVADVSMVWLSKQIQHVKTVFELGFNFDRDDDDDVSSMDSVGTAKESETDDDDDQWQFEIYSFIISSNGTYIAHPDESLILTDNFFERAKLSVDTLDDNLGRRMINGEEGRVKFNNAQRKGVHSFAFFTPIKTTGWSMAVVVPEIRLKIYAYILGFIIFLFMALSVFVLYIISRTLIRRVVKPLTLFSEAASEISQGHIDTKLPEIKSKDELGQLHDSFAAMQTSLLQQMDELRVSNEQRGRIEGELKVASDIQMSMLPKTFPPFPERDDIDIAAVLVPAKAVGGDLYDFYIRDEKLFFCIGDVSGKGVPASLVMAVTRSLFRTISAHEASPERIMGHINESMSEQNDSMMFVTLFIGVLDLPTGRLRYVNAGHDAPILIGDGVEQLAVDSNIPIGVMMDWHFTQQGVLIKPGTTIFLYTDGLNEAENADHGQFGMERVYDVARQVLVANEHTPPQLVGVMSMSVHNFVGNAEQSDDLTMLAIQYTKSVRQELYENSITLQNDVQQVPQLAEFVDGVCEAMGFDMGVAMQMNLAMEEAVVNVMNYAYPAGVKGDIHIKAQANDIRLKFTISDSGTPFDPTAKEEADTTLSAEDRPIGGLGIYLVRQIMDSINYEFVNGQNILTLRKRLRSV